MKQNSLQAETAQDKVQSRPAFFQFQCSNKSVDIPHRKVLVFQTDCLLMVLVKSSHLIDQGYACVNHWYLATKWEKLEKKFSSA